MPPETGRRLEMNKPYGVRVERCNDGQPIISPSQNWWETGVTFNPAAFYLAPTPENLPVIRALLPMRPPNDPELGEGVVAVHYRARPENDPGSQFARSFIGLAVFTPDFKLLYRYKEPVLFPSTEENGYDALGVEDPRVHYLEGRFYMIYCGVQPDPTSNWRANLCLAVSDDMVHWEKRGVMPGEITKFNNKDGVLFPEKIDGKYYLLHRPFDESIPKAEYSVDLAASDSLEGPWEDYGEIMRAFPNPRMHSSWVGAGSVPIRIGEKRYLHILHTGNYLNETDREYDATAAIFDFNALDLSDPRTLLTSRLEPLMVPETPAELRSRSQLQVGNVLFICGSYEYKDWIYFVYGGADTYTLAARVNTAELLQAMETSGLENPYI
jgi:predicted GH43/DUF377 family glycosyl hydrolase